MSLKRVVALLKLINNLNFIIFVCAKERPSSDDLILSIDTTYRDSTHFMSFIFHSIQFIKCAYVSVSVVCVSVSVPMSVVLCLCVCVCAHDICFIYIYIYILSVL